jgi:glycosyltransferase involved in cell wall biosynthesis
MNRPEPLVSIVAPTCDRPEMLAQAIESCLSQDYRNLEVIVVSNASREPTLRTIEHYRRRDERVTMVENRGFRLPGALNSGMKIARGVFLTWISDDNLFRPSAISEMVTFLQEHTDIDVVYTNFSYIDEAGNFISQETSPGPEELPYWNCVGLSFLYRHKIRDEIGDYREDKFLVEDYDYWLRVSLLFKLAALRKDLHCVRAHPDQLGAAYAPEVKRATISLLQDLMDLDKWSASQKALACLRIAREEAALGAKMAALKSLERAARFSPHTLLSRFSIPAVAMLLGGPKGFEALRRITRAILKSKPI